MNSQNKNSQVSFGGQNRLQAAIKSGAVVKNNDAFTSDEEVQDMDEGYNYPMEQQPR
jgi:hypothetical protein